MKELMGRRYFAFAFNPPDSLPALKDSNLKGKS
jgi:hypothetical protein